MRVYDSIRYSLFNSSPFFRVWLLFLLAPFSMSAQYQTFFEHGYEIDHYNDRKVIEYDVSDIWKDPQGRLWIVNVGSLRRYNGYEFDQFQPDASTRMNDARDQFEKVFVDDSGQIWLSSIQGGIVRYQPETDSYQRFRIDEDAFTDFNTRHIVQDRLGDIWIGYTKGLLHFDKNNPESFEEIEIKSLGADLYPLMDKLEDQHEVVASLLNVRNNATEKVNFQLESDASVMVLGQGELAASPNLGFVTSDYQDYGWITNIGGDTIWFMDASKGKHAGGLIENRIHAEWIDLPAGDYTLHFKTNDRYANGDWLVEGGEGAFGATWRYAPPSVEDWWGIQVLICSESAQIEVQKCLQDYQAEKALSSTNVDVFMDRTERIWVYGHTLQELLVDDEGTYELSTVGEWNINGENHNWNQILRVADKDEGHLWMSVGLVDANGEEEVNIGIFNKITGDFTLVKTDLPGDHLYYSLIQDQNENLWIASSNAENLFRLSPPFIMDGTSGQPSLTTFSMAGNEDPIRRIKVLEIDDYNNLWIGTHQQGMYRINLDTKPFHYEDLKGKGVLDGSGLAYIRGDQWGNLWMLTYKMQAIRYHPEKGEIESFQSVFKGIPFRYLLYMEDLPNGNPVFITEKSFIEYDIARDRAIERKPKGMDWVSARTGRFATRKGFYFNDSLLYIPGHLVNINTWELAKNLDGLLEGARWIAAPSQENGVWIGKCWGEVGKLDFEDEMVDTLERYTSFAYNVDILEDDRGEVWLANNFNLKTLGRNGQAKEYFTSSRGIRKPIRHANIFQYEDFIWLFTPHGSSLVNVDTRVGTRPSELADLEIQDAFQTDEGVFTLAGMEGIYFFDPEQLKEDSLAPKVIIDQLTYNSGDTQNVITDFNLDKPLKLRYHQNDVTIDYVGLQFNNPLKTTYQYQLLGLSDQWQEVGSERTARFLNLPTGSYTFRLQAFNGDGYLSEVVSVDFLVLPPWWWTTIAKVFYVLLVLLTLYGFINSRILKLKREKQEEKDFTEALIFAQEEERKRIARDLHDGVGQSLLLIKKQMDADLEVSKENRSLISSTLEEVRSISQDLHPFQLEKFGLTVAIHSVIDKVGKSTDLFITQEIDNIDGLLNSKAEINFYRTIQEGFNNIVKHAEASAARLEISRTPNQIVARIKDNGKGFDYSIASATSKSLGLKTMHERVSTIGGKLDFQSAQPSGTEVRIEIDLQGS